MRAPRNAAKPREWIRSAVRRVQQLLTAIGLLFVLITFTPLVPWWAKALAGPWNDPQGEVLIVLGGSMLGSGMLGGSSYWRAIYGTLAYQEGGFREVVISGGGEGKPVAAHMRDFLVSSGVPASVIRIEGESASTRENALNTQKLLAHTPGRKVLLTSDYHMFRAHRAFRKAGMEVLPRPFPHVRKLANCRLCRWSAFLELIRESFKITYYYWRGWI